MPGIWPSQPAGRLHGIEVCFGELVLQPPAKAAKVRTRNAMVDFFRAGMIQRIKSAESPFCKTPRNVSGKTCAMEKLARTSLMRTVAMTAVPCAMVSF